MCTHHWGERCSSVLASLCYHMAQCRAPGEGRGGRGEEEEEEGGRGGGGGGGGGGEREERKGEGRGEGGGGEEEGEERRGTEINHSASPEPDTTLMLKYITHKQPPPLPHTQECVRVTDLSQLQHNVSGFSCYSLGIAVAHWEVDLSAVAPQLGGVHGQPTGEDPEIRTGVQAALALEEHTVL